MTGLRRYWVERAEKLRHHVRVLITQSGDFSARRSIVAIVEAAMVLEGRRVL